MRALAISHWLVRLSDFVLQRDSVTRVGRGQAMSVDQAVAIAMRDTQKETR